MFHLGSWPTVLKINNGQSLPLGRTYVISCADGDTVSLSRFLSSNLQEQFNMVHNKFVICSFGVYAWLFLVLSKKAKLRWLFLTWGLYLLGLVVSIATVFIIVGNSLDKERFLGPNGLKMTLCITPLLVLLLLRRLERVFSVAIVFVKR